MYAECPWLMLCQAHSQPLMADNCSILQMRELRLRLRKLLNSHS